MNSEVDKFDQLSHVWWDVNGEMRTLHHINPSRLEFILKFTQNTSSSVLDIGCGGGIFSESIAKLGFNVTGIDVAPSLIEVAKLHLHESNLSIDYLCEDVKTFSLRGKKFDVITCLDMLEHVDDPQEIISYASSMLNPNGIIALSTINRNLISYTKVVFLGEYILRLLPKLTHEYSKFIKPSELNRICKMYNLSLLGIQGINYSPFTKAAKLNNNVNANYITMYSSA